MSLFQQKAQVREWNGGFEGQNEGEEEIEMKEGRTLLSRFCGKA